MPESNQSLRARLTEINAHIAFLEAERKGIQKRLQSVTFPVLSLPFEVVSDIFVQCLPDLQDTEPIFNFKRQRLPTALLLTQICRAWREIGSQIPQIWALFRIDVDDWPKDHAIGRGRFVEWVERASSLPLSFVFKQRNTYSLSMVESTISAAIFAVSIQWQNVNLRLSYQDLMTEEIQSAMHGRLPILETLQITTDSTDSTVVTAFELAPCLRSVILERLSPVLILLPWSQITHFCGHTFTVMDCLYVLRSAVSLVEGKFHVVGKDMDQTAPLPPHLALKVLQLRGESMCPYLLPFLTLPSLAELDYEEMGESDQPFVAFLSRSRPPLSHLSLHGGSYLRIMQGFPLLFHLTILDISHLTVVSLLDFLRRLRASPSESFLPHLEFFTARSVWQSVRYRDSAMDYEDLRYTLEFRWNRNGLSPKLKYFGMEWRPDGYSDLDDHAKKSLLIPPLDFRLNLPRPQELVQDGMHISVTAKVDKMSAVWI